MKTVNTPYPSSPNFRRCTVGLAALTCSCAVLLGSARSATAATTITFEALAQQGTDAQVVPNGYREAGYVFTSNNLDGYDLAAWQTDSPYYPGSTALFDNNYGGVITLTQAGGGEFSILSLNLAPITTFIAPQSVTLTGLRPDGSTVTQTFAVPGSGPNVVTETAFSFTEAGFGDVRAVLFAPDFTYQFDNVTVAAAAVPEPSTWALLALGAGTLLAAGVRRGRKGRRGGAASLSVSGVSALSGSTAAILIVATGLPFTPSGVRADLLGTPVTGSLFFGPNPNNWFNPANGYVPPGYLNATSATVTISDSGTEFGFQDLANLDFADFTGTTLTIGDFMTGPAGTAAVTMRFTDNAFIGATLVETSDNFPTGGFTASLSGNQIILNWAGIESFSPGVPGDYTATYSVTTAVPEPSTYTLAGLGSLSLMAAALRRRASNRGGIGQSPGQGGLIWP